MEYNDLELLQPTWGPNAHFQYGEIVAVDFGTAGRIERAKVIAFHQYRDKCKYDLEVEFGIQVDGQDIKDHIRLYNVEGRCLAKRF